MCSQLYKHFGKKLEDEYIVLQNAKEKCIVQNWSSDSITGGIGVYFSSLASSGSNIELLSTTFPSTYIKGKTYDQIKFVIDSKGYVPTMSKNESLLDKIFYTDYN